MGHTQFFSGALLVVGMALFAAPGHAQEFNCSLGKVTERVAPMYSSNDRGTRPAEGIVTVLATFAPDGKVTSTKVISGPQPLRFDTESFVRGWRAQPSSDVRQCAIVAEYRFDDSFRACNSRTQVRVRAEHQDDNHVLMHLSCEAW